MTIHSIEYQKAGEEFTWHYWRGKSLDHYELRRLVGKGGMANVYEALDLQTQQKVAVKVFKREDEELLRRFMREAQRNGIITSRASCANY